MTGAARSKANQRRLRGVVNAFNRCHSAIACAATRADSVDALVTIERQYLAIDEVAVGTNKLLDEIGIHRKARKSR